MCSLKRRRRPPGPPTSPKPVASVRSGSATHAPQRKQTIIHGAQIAEKRATPLKPYAATNVVTATNTSVSATHPALVGYHADWIGNPNAWRSEVAAIAVIVAA